MDGKIKMTFSLTALILLIAACLLLMGWRLGLPPFSEAGVPGSLRASGEGTYAEHAVLRELRFDLSGALEDESAEYVLRSESGFIAGILKGPKDGTPELLEIDVFSGSLMNSAPQTVVSQLNETEGSLDPLAWRLEKDSPISWHTGSAGAFSAWLGLNRETKTAVAVAVNYGLVNAEQIGFAVIKGLKS